jgi:Glycosyltransferase family 87
VRILLNLDALGAMKQRFVLVAALAACALMLAALPVTLPHGDFDEYWAAGRLNAGGMNPYDAAAMLQEQRLNGWPEPRPVMMYNPPWTLALAMPVAQLDLQHARSLWLLAQILICLWCASRVWAQNGGAPQYEVRIWCLALLWMPTVSALRMGQISPLVLLGLVGFVWSLEKRRDLTAGVFFALTAVKPQLVALIWVGWLLWTIREGRWKVMLGTAAALGGATLVAVAANPPVFSQYLHLMSTQPPILDFESPNIATLIRVVLTAVFGTGTWPQYVPTAVGAGIVAWFWSRRHRTWDWAAELPWLVSLSCMATSYGGWTFDLLILLVPIIATAAVVARVGNGALTAAAAALFLGVTLGSFAMLVARYPEAMYLWVTPVVALCAGAVTRFARARQTPGVLFQLHAHS